MARACAAVGLSLYLSGCGGGGDETSSSTTTKKKTTATTTTPAATKPATTPATTIATTPATTTGTTTTAAHACDSPFWTATHSCFAGVVVDNEKEIICGGNPPDGIAVYSRETTSCAGQTLRFNPKKKFFCYDEMHDNSVGKCVPWTDDFDTRCTCKSLSTVASAKNESKAKVASAGWAEIVDTRKPPTAEDEPGGPCYKPDPWAGGRGCMNGHRYNYASQLPCGTLLIQPDKFGCCPTEGQYSHYNLQKQSCCKQSNGEYAVKEGGHACGCTTCSGSIV